MYQNYIFDLYGTLIDIHTNEKKTYLWEKLCEFYRFHGADYETKELRQTYESLCKKYLSESSSYTYPEIQIEDVFEDLFTQKNVHITKELAMYTGQFFRILSTSYVRLYDGVIPLLTSLKEQGGHIYVLSNAQRIFTAYEMKHLGIYDLFDGIVLSSDEGCMKPDPEFFQIVLDRYQLSKKDSIMIGNDAVSDIEGAANAGIDSLYLHSNLSPAITSKLKSTYSIMDLDLEKAKHILLDH
ncbi:hypothetical protein lbkm_0506 [Lachnospiraceae bacterium KM106-2]|nr:hypothetical protein lbkm_0506 [Lachnospiraceae bacterium KM106-2]